MTKDELIANQQIEIEELKQKSISFVKAKEKIHSILYCIGGPLNDNKLLYSREQLLTFIQIRDAIEVCNE